MTDTLDALEDAHLREEGSELGRNWVDEPRRLSIRVVAGGGSRQDGALDAEALEARVRVIAGWRDADVVDPFMSYGPWLALRDGSCLFDATGASGHARHGRVRAYFGAPTPAKRDPDERDPAEREPHFAPDLLATTRDALCGRFEALRDGHVEGHRLGLRCRSDEDARAVQQAARRAGLLLERRGDELGFTVPTMATDRATGHGLDALRRALKEHEGETDAPEPVAPTKTRETRVRQVPADVEGETMLARIVALEAAIYEPARRDPIDKLRLAFDDPAGVAVVAEARATEDDEWSLVGFSLGAPLERVSVEDPPGDLRRAARDTLYAISTTLDSSVQGYGLGFRMKRELMRGARDVRRMDGSPRYHHVSGRNRVGMTGAMQRVNARLGAFTIAVLDGQYGGKGSARYYQMPLREPRPAPATPSTRDPFDALDAPFGEPPRTLRLMRERGGLYGARVSPFAQPSRISPAALRAAEYIRAWVPTLGGLHPCRDRDSAFEVARELVGVKELCALGDAPAGMRRVELDALDATLAQSSCALIVEPVCGATGHVLTDADVQALRRARDEHGTPIVCVETTRAFMRGGERFESESALEPDVIVWGRPGAWFVHGPEDSAPTQAGAESPPSELALIRTHHELRAARGIAPGWERLDDALATHEAFGRGGYRVLRMSEGEAEALMARLGSEGIGARRVPAGVAIVPALDLDASAYETLARVLGA